MLFELVILLNHDQENIVKFSLIFPRRKSKLLLTQNQKSEAQTNNTESVHDLKLRITL